MRLACELVILFFLRLRYKLRGLQEDVLSLIIPGIIIWTVSIMIDVIDGLGPHLSLLCPSLSIAAAGGQSAPTSAASPVLESGAKNQLAAHPPLTTQPQIWLLLQSIRSQEEFKISRPSLQNLTAVDLPSTAPRATGLKVS